MLTFIQLPIGARFAFVGEYGADYDWHWHVKTGERTYEGRRWCDGSGGEPGVVGVGDNPVLRKGDHGSATRP